MGGNQMAEKEEFEDKRKEVEGVCTPIMTAMYSGGGGMPTGGSGTAAPDVEWSTESERLLTRLREHDFMAPPGQTHSQGHTHTLRCGAPCHLCASGITRSTQLARSCQAAHTG